MSNEGEIERNMQNEVLGYCMIGRYTLSELASMIGASEEKVAEQLGLLQMTGFIVAYTPDGKEATPPFFSSDTIFTQSKS